MKILRLVQGSDEWRATRGQYHTASEAPAMMGCGKVSREDLVRMRATGSDYEFSAWVEEVLFAEGHRVEEAARPIAEEILGEELYPVTAISDDGKLLASLDGLTMAEDVIWECKQWNMEKARKVAAGEMPAEDTWQVIQQLVVTGAEKCLYMVTDGTEDSCQYMFFSLHGGDEETLRNHWAQFEDDVANYAHEAVKPEPIGRAPEDLPALRLEVTGNVVASNLQDFTEHAMAVFQGISTELSTDEDFANAEKTVKWCQDVEDKLEGAKQAALEQTASIDELFRAIDAIRDEARTKRLELNRLVKARKESLRSEIITAARDELADFIVDLCEGIPVVASTIDLNVSADFAGAIKGKRTVKSLRDAAADCLAAAKVEASTLAARVSANLNWYVENYHQAYFGLFPDLAQIAQQERETFESIVIARVKREDERVEAARQALEQQEAQPAEHQQAPAVSQPAPQQCAATEEPRRPTLHDMTNVLAAHYRVSPQQVQTWLYEDIAQQRAA